MTGTELIKEGLSLPLKKRRFRLVSEDYVQEDNDREKCAPQMRGKVNALATLTSSYYKSVDFSKLSALAVVATSSSPMSSLSHGSSSAPFSEAPPVAKGSLEIPVSPGIPRTVIISSIDRLQKHQDEHQSPSETESVASIVDGSMVEGKTEASSCNIRPFSGPSLSLVNQDSSPQLLPGHPSETKETQDSGSSDIKVSISSTTRPRLLKPLPNGCHGRTNRYNSYCRKMPCYNGSRFCKMHYQLYVVHRIRSNEMIQKPTNVTEGGSTLPMNLKCENAKDNLKANRPGSRPLQDRRFLAENEKKFGHVRCSATSTRGKLCAYVAVNSTKYCYLHINYDIDPPPKRGRGSNLLSLQFQQCRQHQPHQKKLQTDNFFPLLEPKNSSIQTRLDTQVASCIPIGLKMLSMISTERWRNKRVFITHGPFKRHYGTVETWRNGWVKVRLDQGMGIHNRRSFELLVSPEQQQLSPLHDGGNNASGTFPSLHGPPLKPPNLF